MSLLYAVLLFSISLIVMRAAYAGSRRPGRPWWASEGVTTFLMIVVVGMFAFGVAFLSDVVFGWERQSIGMTQVASIAGVLVAAALLWWLLGRLLPVAGKAVVMDLPRAVTDDPDSPDHGDPTPAPTGSPARLSRDAA